ncbi:MAG: hypothetical protein L6R39_006573 [Caloplaca ligustica]|nr:MAG: hypothetical protein L6R39_006573 [Caloplaca ligustica]
MGQWHRDGVYNVVPAIVFLLLDTLALVLRCFAKRKTKARFGSDDAWIVIAGVQFYVWISLIIQAASLEGTIDPMNLYFKVPDDDNTRVMELVYVAEFFFFGTITAVKLSILSFYRRIFVTTVLRPATYILSTLCVMWLLTAVFFFVFGCDPVEANYVVTYPTKSHCKPFGIFNFFLELINALFDVAILAMPCFIIPKLHLNKRQKYQVLGIFLTGGFVLVCCILRMAYTFSPEEFYMVVQSFPGRIAWSTVQLGVAIICACLPTYRPLIPKSFGLSSTGKHWYFSFYKITRSEKGVSTQEGLAEQSSEWINLGQGDGKGTFIGGQANVVETGFWGKEHSNDGIDHDKIITPSNQPGLPAPAMAAAGLKTIIALSFILAIGFLLVILSSALWRNYLPLLVVATYILAPLPNWICGRCSNPDDFMESSGSAVLDFGRFCTGFLVVMGIALPALLAHCDLIRVPAMAMSIVGGLLIYGTIISFTMFFQEEQDF